MPAAGGEMEIEEDLRTRVVTAAAKREQTLQTAPGVVDVITADEIEAAGYRSVGEALQPLAGIVVYNDYVYYNVGVRGIMGGERSGSRIVKVLIDGQPIAYRTSSANFLGPEMIPIELVERIEIIRGPGSVLYGANAFLGGINVVTKSASAFAPTEAFGAAQGAGLRMVGGGTSGQSSAAPATSSLQPPRQSPGGFGSLVGGAISGDLEVVGGFSASQLDRSGLALPASSPRYKEVEQNPYSSGDSSSPRSAFGRVSYKSPTLGRVRLTGIYQDLDSRGEFQDRNTLSHDNSVRFTNLLARADMERGLGSATVLKAYGAYSQGQPGDHYVTSTADGKTGLRLDDGFRAADAGLEATARLGELFHLLAGADFSWDEEKLPVVQRVSLQDQPGLPAGAVIPGTGGGRVPFRNLGGYALATLTPLASFEGAIRDLGVTGGLRYEANSVYGGSLNWRGGLVVPLSEQWYLKALGGSSFKGPSAEELYATPLQLGDPAGNPDLKPQTAITAEAVLGYSPSRYLAASLVGFYSQVRDQIRYRNTVGGQIPENMTRQDSEGAELQLRISKPFRSWTVSGLANATYVYSTAKRLNALGDRSVAVEPDLYPTLTANTGIQVRHRPSHLGIYLEGRFLGARPPSRDNEDFWLRGGTYELPPAFILDAALSTDRLALTSAVQLRAQLRVTNLLNSVYALPGFYGFDIPGQPRTYTLSVEMAF